MLAQVCTQPQHMLLSPAQSLQLSQHSLFCHQANSTALLSNASLTVM